VRGVSRETKAIARVMVKDKGGESERTSENEIEGERGTDRVANE
jgi:hypothetical protein